MTLVVARIWGPGRVTIVSDTAITDGRSHLVDEHRALKSLILTPTLCINYAGEGYDYAAERILSVPERFRRLAPRAIARFLAADDPIREYIIASVDDAGIYLARCGNGAVDEGRPSYWIGEHKAFASFQAAMSRGEFEPTALNQLDRLTHVIEHGQIVSVGGCAVRVELTPAGFRYVGDSSVYFDRETHAEVSVRGDRTRIRIPSEPATHAVFKCVPRESGVAAIGLWFSHAKVGYLLCPSRGGRQKVSGESCDEFVASVAARFGIRLRPVAMPIGLLPP